HPAGALTRTIAEGVWAVEVGPSAHPTVAGGIASWQTLAPCAPLPDGTTARQACDLRPVVGQLCALAGADQARSRWQARCGAAVLGRSCASQGSCPQRSCWG